MLHIIRILPKFLSAALMAVFTSTLLAQIRPTIEYTEQIKKASSIEELRSINERVIADFANSTNAKNAKDAINYIDIERSIIDRIVEIKNEIWSDPKADPSQRKRISSTDAYQSEVKGFQEYLEKTIKEISLSANPDLRSLAEIKLNLAIILETHTTRFPKKDEDYYGKRRSFARTQLEDALALVGSTTKGADPLLLAIKIRLVMNYIETGDFERAIPLLDEYIVSIESAFGPKSEYLIVPLTARLLLYRTAEDPENSVKLSGRLEKDFAILPEKVSFLSITGRTSGEDFPGRKEKEGLIERTWESLPEVNVTPLRRVTAEYDGKLATGIPVIVRIDENGNVITANIPDKYEKVRKTIEKGIYKWKFKPLLIDGKPVKMTGLVHYWVKR